MVADEKWKYDVVLFIRDKAGPNGGKLWLLEIWGLNGDFREALLKDPDGENVDVHTYRSMIGSLMYITSSRPDIMFAVCACARFQVTPKASHLHAVKRIFRYLKGKPQLGLWYPKDSPFDLVAYLDSEYAGVSLDRKSTTRGCQLLRCRLIFWQCKKQTVIATSSIEAEYIAAASCCAQVLWIQNQLLDYGSNKYALTVNPNIYVSCIEQFWTTVAVKTVNDVIRLQTLVDKKKVVVTVATIREALYLDDPKGVECLPTKEIFAELARMCMSAKRTSWNEFSSSMASAVICLSSGRKFNFSKYIFDSLVRNVDSPSKFYMYPRFLQLMIRKQVGKGFSRVKTPLFEGMLVAQEVAEEGDVKVHGEEVNAGDATKGDVSAAHAEVPTVDKEPSIPSPTPPTLPPQPSHDIPSTSQVQQTPPLAPQRVETSDETVMDDVSNQGRMIAEMDQDADVVLEDDKEEAKEVAKDDKEDETKPTEVQEVVDVVTTAKIITKVVITASETITDASETITAAKAQAYAVTLTAAHVRVNATPRRRTKGVVIREPQEESTTSTIIPAKTKSKDKEAKLNKNIDWDEAIDHVKKKAKEDHAVKRYQVLKRKPQTEAQARKNMMVYLKNVAGFKMDYFKGMSYDDIRPIFEAKFNTNVTFLQKIKEQIKDKESRALKRLNETPAKKATKRQKLDEEPDIHSQVWKNQRSVHGLAKVKGWKLLESCGVQIITFTTTQLILLVERKYPLTRFTLDQMLNAIRLEVEEESEVSLELLRNSRKTYYVFNAVGERLSAAKPKMILLINAAETN
uniref:Uncharacterized mitochondrial protein AtMg00810-like n=1 Tax=Tanacetum cinerariifolium TaxID=118510 RepID=A0A699HK14_TANCI|nr:uncharacterized mitochondrial protein AtMg00810-like [Tanacetum cinerariifolium]